VSEDLGRLTDEDLGHLTDEDLERIEAIVDGSVRRRHGEDVLAAVEASDNARQGPHPLLEALARAYQAREKGDHT
jgi:hypothetical protein